MKTFPQTNEQPAVAESGTGMWELGTWNTRTCDVGTRGLRGSETGRRKRAGGENVGTQGRGTWDVGRKE